MFVYQHYMQNTEIYCVCSTTCRKHYLLTEALVPTPLVNYTKGCVGMGLVIKVFCEMAFEVPVHVPIEPWIVNVCACTLPHDF